MNKKERTPQEKKLAMLRKILLLCFAGITVPLVACFVPLLFIFRANNSFGFLGMTEITILAVAPLMLVGLVGAVCLVIYQVFKYRMEKDEDLFL